MYREMKRRITHVQFLSTRAAAGGAGVPETRDTEC